jgi:sec-independent protein translocase protein TatA
MGIGLGPFEIILIFAVTLLMFGAKRLPELASGMGKGIRNFKHALNSANDDSPAPVEMHIDRGLAAPALIPADLTVAAQPVAVAGDLDRVR